MSWEVGIIKNTVRVTASAVDPYVKAFQAQYGDDYEADTLLVSAGDGLFSLGFIEGWMEGIDHLSDELIGILVKHGARGDVCFGTVDGGGSGPDFWGHRFGEDGYTRLQGGVVFRANGAGEPGVIEDSSTLLREASGRVQEAKQSGRTLVDFLREDGAAEYLVDCAMVTVQFMGDIAAELHRVASVIQEHMARELRASNGSGEGHG